MKIVKKADVWPHLVESIQELMEELGQEPGDLTMDVMLMADLGITSVDAIHLMISLEDRIGRPLSYKDMVMRDQRMPTDLSLGQLLDMICQGLKIPA